VYLKEELKQLNVGLVKKNGKIVYVGKLNKT